jgi:tripartite-type tricarboxylate transporter receptor subunit TctC
MGKTRGISAIAALACMLCAAGTRAEDGFYAGKTVTFVVGYGVNTGYDIYSRIVARHIGKYLPGQPNVVVQNMPGAASLTAMGYLYNTAPHDGTTLGMIDQAVALTQLISPHGFRADVTKFNWIGRITDNAAILFAWHAAAVQKIEDAYQKTLTVAANGQNSRMMSALLKNLLGLKFKIVTGYPSSAASVLAMERGEVDATTMPWSVLRSERADWIKDKKINLLLQIGTESHPGLEQVPLVTSIARNDEERQILELMSRDSRVGRSIMSPPGEPTERVADLRKAFMETTKDPSFLDEIHKSDLDLAPMDGADLQKLMDQAMDVSPDLVQKAIDLTKGSD